MLVHHSDRLNMEVMLSVVAACIILENQFQNCAISSCDHNLLSVAVHQIHTCYAQRMIKNVYKNISMYVCNVSQLRCGFTGKTK